MYTVKYLFSGENLQNKAINLVELKNKFPSIIEKIQINEHFFFQIKGKIPTLSRNKQNMTLES